MADDVTLQVLIDIRDGVRATNERIDQLRTDMNTGFAEVHTRIDGTNTRIEDVRAELRGEQLEAEVRRATRETELTSATRNLQVVLEENFKLRERVERCEHDIAELENKVG